MAAAILLLPLAVLIHVGPEILMMDGPAWWWPGWGARWRSSRSSWSLRPEISVTRAAGCAAAADRRSREDPAGAGFS